MSLKKINNDSIQKNKEDLIKSKDNLVDKVDNNYIVINEKNTSTIEVKTSSKNIFKETLENKNTKKTINHEDLEFLHNEKCSNLKPEEKLNKLVEKQELLIKKELNTFREDDSSNIPNPIINIKKVKNQIIDVINNISNLKSDNDKNEEVLQKFLNLNFSFREIRVRLSRSNNFESKQYMLYGIIYYDLFDINKVCFLDKILEENSLILETLKLLNVLTNEYKGRTYLLYNDKIIVKLINIMKTENKESEIRQNSIGIIQKLTLNVASQNLIIENNVLEYIVDILSPLSNEVTQYTLEYGLALIMNLSLRKWGKDKCFENSVSHLKLNIVVYYNKITR
jgi:hypothetical protein